MKSAPLDLHDEADAAEAIHAVAEHADTFAFATLFRRYGPRLRTYMSKAGATPSEAEELTQETLAQIWRRAGTYDRGRATPSAWIFTIARNLRIDARRRARRLPDGITAFTEDAAEPITPELIYGTEEQERRVKAALAVLPPEHHEVLSLSYFDDLTQTQIAARLGLPLGTVKSRVRLAIARLRSALDDGR